MEQGNDIIYKNVKLLSTQDTYYTKGKRTYWGKTGRFTEQPILSGGDGDIFFNECLLYINKDSYIAAPATSTSWGYVFMNCTIDGTVNSYKLGRSWNNSPKCVYINTTMKKQPTAAGWGDPMNVVPSIFAEYNSRTAAGSTVNLGSRRTTYSKNGTSVTLQPVLTAEQAAQYTIENVMGSLKPNLLTRQVGAPVVRLEGTTLEWDDNDSVLCWMVFRNGKFYKCIIDNFCEIPDEEPEAAYTVRAANAMGGLGPASEEVDGRVTAPVVIRDKFDRHFSVCYNSAQKNFVSGQRLRRF
jgi:pectin methylesterase-like acyl-CoA thioesterase